MDAQGFHLFDTAIGRCAIAWSANGVCGVQLPESDEAAARARLRRRFPQAVEAEPPPAVATTVAAIAALVGGGPRDLSGVVLDLEPLSPFHRRVYEIARAIPPGETLTYGEIAARAGEPGAARAVGQAMGQNPFPIVVPCHRVLAADGRAGGFSARGGVATKLRLLEIEGALAAERLPLFAPRPHG